MSHTDVHKARANYTTRGEGEQLWVRSNCMLLFWCDAILREVWE